MLSISQHLWAVMSSIAAIRGNLQFPKSGKFHLLKSPLTTVEVGGLFAHAIAEQDKLNPIPTPTGAVLGSREPVKHRIS